MEKRNNRRRSTFLLLFKIDRLLSALLCFTQTQFSSKALQFLFLFLFFSHSSSSASSPPTTALHSLLEQLHYCFLSTPFSSSSSGYVIHRPVVIIVVFCFPFLLFFSFLFLLRREVIAIPPPHSNGYFVFVCGGRTNFSRYFTRIDFHGGENKKNKKRPYHSASPDFGYL